jgi:serine/threonine protein kinase
MPLPSGARLGSYELLGSIGRGGMGEVYRARDSKLGRQVAVKVLRPDFASDPERLRRFEQEARAASALNHPNIVHIYEIGEDAGTHFIAMELVEGRSLREILAEAPLDGERILDLARQLADGLAKAHAAGIVHRDVKPENVMVTEDGFVKILDFGLAKLVALPFASGDSEMATLARTRHGMLIGTVEYMSPEQASGKSSVDHRSDQFSLGLIVYEMVTGKLAFQRETAAQTLASIIESEPPPMTRFNPGGPPGLDAVVARCLSKDPASRYPDTRELSMALKSLSVEGGGNVQKLPESRLRRYLGRSRYSGVEMVRREADEVWVPLHETRVRSEEIPHRDGSEAESDGLRSAPRGVSRVRRRDVLQDRRNSVLDGVLGDRALESGSRNASGVLLPDAIETRHPGARREAEGGPS